jgi:hypothetical protein
MDLEGGHGAMAKLRHSVAMAELLLPLAKGGLSSERKG